MDSAPHAAPPGQGRPHPWLARAAWGDAFHAYANWLVGLSWLKFALLSVLLLVIANLMEDLPPFRWISWQTSEEVADKPPRPADVPTRPAGVARASSGVQVKIEPTPHGKPLEIAIDGSGVRIGPPSAAASAASAAQGGGVTIHLPPGADADNVREAVEEARRDIEEAVRDAQEARRDAEEARREVLEAPAVPAPPAPPGTRRVRVHTVHLGDFLVNTALIFIFASVAIKLSYKGRIQAEAKAAQATEVAEAESLKRQVVEARMAAMQAQVEPHFLFNTLASIDHLIETDPPRASQMQKNLIALLRAAMPGLREGGARGTRALGRELDVVRPYLEILKVRMEDRLSTDIQVSEGLYSAAFPPMMLQSLVENAIKHGLEPKPEGGRLTVRAEIAHGKLVVTVADTGLGFGRAATAGTGTGLANIRERLQLLYGSKAQLSITENAPSGTVVAITVPYELTQAQAA